MEISPGGAMADGVGKAFLGAAKQGMRVRWRERREVVVEVEVNVPPGDAGGEQAEGLGKAGGEFAAPGSDGIAEFGQQEAGEELGFADLGEAIVGGAVVGDFEFEVEGGEVMAERVVEFAGDLEAFAEAVVMLLAGSLAAQTGTAVAELAGLDAAMQTYLKEGKTPGGALAVSRGGKLIYARGFGVMETERNTPVQPDSLFRVGSVSKPVTAMAALRLVQDGKLRLEDGVVTLLGLPASQIADPRWNQITVRHLLQHSGGWDAEASFDPLGSYEGLEGLGLSIPLWEPLTVDQVIGFMATQPLQFAPGTRFAYSNFGMLMLGRIVAKVSGRPYEEAVRGLVLERMGIQRMRLGGSLPSQRALGGGGLLRGHGAAGALSGGGG